MDVQDFSFGPFRFDPRQALLLRGGEALSIGRRQAALLVALLQRRGEVVTKSDLMDAAWPGEAVEESNLSVQIAQIRRRIGGGWIRTVERVGYVFTIEEPPSPVARPVLSAPSVAVLPFTDVTGYPELPLGTALAEEVLTALARFRSLAVAARGSSFRFAGPATDIREVARRLEVRYVVEGSIRNGGGRLRLALRLIDGKSGAHLWAENLEQPMQLLPDTDELAGRAAAMIEGQLHLAEIGRAEREQPERLEAYDLYLMGRRHLLSSREDGNATGYLLFARGLALAPNGLPLLAAMAEVFHHRKAVGWPTLEGTDDRATLDLVRRGLEHPGLDAVSLALFANALRTAGEIDLGSLMAERAVALNPNSALIQVCVGLDRVWEGNLDGGERAFRRALELSPGHPAQRFALQGLSKASGLRGDYEKTIFFARQALAVSPGLSGGHSQLIMATALLGRFEEARDAYARYRRIAPGVTIDSLRAGQAYSNPDHVVPFLEGLRLAGMPER